MISHFIAESVAHRRAEIDRLDHVQKTYHLNLCGNDLRVVDIRLNEKETAYYAKTDFGTEIELARVTSYCDKWDNNLLFWGLTVAKQHGPRAMAECLRVQEAAKLVGSELHSYACARMRGLIERGDFSEFTSPDTAHCALLFDDWWEGSKDKFKVVATEFTLWSTIWKFAGTGDLLLWDRESCQYKLVDFKTTPNVSAGYKLQAGAYQYCLSQIGRAAESASLVLFPKPGQGNHWTEHTLWTKEEHSLPFQAAFLSLCGVVDRLKSAKRGKKKHGLPIASPSPSASFDWDAQPEITDEEADRLFASFR